METVGNFLLNVLPLALSVEFLALSLNLVDRKTASLYDRCVDTSSKRLRSEFTICGESHVTTARYSYRLFHNHEISRYMLYYSDKDYLLIASL